MRLPVAPHLLAAATLALAVCCARTSGAGDSCVIDSQEILAGASNPANACQLCQPSSSARSWSDSAPGSPCADGGVCQAGSCQHGCVVAANFYAEGALDPAQACQSCQPQVATDRFSPLTGLASAGQCDPTQVCADGACEVACFIGSQVVAAGQHDPLDPCTSCVPAARLDGYSQSPDGTPCGDGGAVCALGVCSASCVIGGIAFAAGPSPGNPCLTCDPDASFSTWLALSGPAPGGACGSGQVCGGGACRTGCIIDGGFLSGQTIDPAGGCLVCDPAQGTEGWSPLTGIPLSGCASGQVCAQGSCRAGCFIDGGFTPNRGYRPDQVSNCCNALVNTTGWTSSFGSPPGIPTGTDPRNLIVGDFDGDGGLDLLLDNSVYLGDSDGGFLAPVPDNGLGTFTPSLTGRLGQLVIGDFNHDGLIDIAFIDGTAPGVELGGEWDAGFGPESLLTVFHPPTALFAADLNGDGFTDLISIEAIAPGYFPEVFLAIGDGGFGPARPALGAKEPMLGMAAADFNGDGALDLSIVLTTPDGGDNRVIVLLNDGSGRFTAPTLTISGLTGNPIALAAGDLNGDGKLDLVVATSLELDLAVGDGQGGFHSASSIASPISGTRLLSADFNGDGALDLILVSPLGTFLVANRGDGTFYPPALVATGGAQAVADFNGDGAPDLLLTDLGQLIVALGGCP